MTDDGLQKPIRMTRQRCVILDQLRKMKCHPSADEVYQRVREELPRVSLGTIYRNLDVLCECGLIQRLETAGTQRRFDGNAGEHYHVRCIVCDRIDDIELDVPDEIEQRAREAGDFDIVGHRLEFVGICPACRKARSQNASTN
jgi:Fur family ferric uptake transcriptional regulator